MIRSSKNVKILSFMPFYRLLGWVPFESLSFKNQEKISGYSEALDVLGIRVALPDKYVSRK